MYVHGMEEKGCSMMLLLQNIKALFFFSCKFVDINISKRMKLFQKMMNESYYFLGFQNFIRIKLFKK